jgi:hypothetical protein
VRRRYAELERRLSRAGWPRPAGVTVREYLAAVGVLPEDAEAGAATRRAPTTPDAPVAPGVATRPAADLAGIYELARYSARAVDVALAQYFEGLARAFEV